MPSDTFGNRLAVMRHELGLTLEEAADRAGLKRATWRTWERGISKPRDMAAVVTKIAGTFEYDAMWLMWGGPLGVGHDPDGGTTPGSPQPSSTDGYQNVSHLFGDAESVARRDPADLVEPVLEPVLALPAAS